MIVRLRNAQRDPLKDQTRILVYRQRDRKLLAEATITRPKVKIEGLPDLELLHVRAFPQKHRPAAKFARSGSKITMHFPIRPEAVRRIHVFELDPELRALIRTPEAIGDEELAGLLNIWAKLKETPLGTATSGGLTVADHVLKILRVNRDRIWFKPIPTMLELVNAAEAEFYLVSGMLHSLAGYELAASFKTRELYGNLQLTFFRGLRPGMPEVVEADIDDAGGLLHAFQVLRNAIAGRPTHPYDIHEILTFYQELDPGYRLIV